MCSTTFVGPLTGHRHSLPPYNRVYYILYVSVLKTLTIINYYSFFSLLYLMEHIILYFNLLS